MTPIEIHASDINRKSAQFRAKLWLAGGVLAFLALPYGMVFALVCIGVAFWFGGPELASQLSHRPSFEANEDGFVVFGQKFSVTDRNRVKWEDYRGAELRDVGLVGFLSQQYVVIKTANSGEQKIHPAMMRGTPEQMLNEIIDYARSVLVAKGMGVLLAEVEGRTYQIGRRVNPSSVPQPNVVAAPVPSLAPQEPEFAPRPSFSERMAATQSSPVQSVPSLRERLTGRRKDLI